MRRAVHRLRTAGLCLALAFGCGGPAEPPAHSSDPLDDVEARELYRRGMLLGQEGDYIRAEQYIAAAIDHGFPEDEAMPMLMQVCVEASRLVAALEYAEPYLQRHPEQWSLRVLVATIHMGLEHDDRARSELERAIRDADEAPPQAHYLLGVLLRDRFDDAEGALTNFRRYLELEPEGPHREEARAALPPEERGLPVPVAPEGESTAQPVPERVQTPAPVEESPNSSEEEGEAAP